VKALVKVLDERVGISGQCVGSHRRCSHRRQGDILAALQCWTRGTHGTPPRPGVEGGVLGTRFGTGYVTTPRPEGRSF
jgi:hypothetical protein